MYMSIGDMEGMYIVVAMVGVGVGNLVVGVAYTFVDMVLVGGCFVLAVGRTLFAIALLLPVL